LALALGGFVATAGLTLLGLAHGSEAAVVVSTTILFAGIGLSFAAMPNLILEWVPGSQSGEATGFNALVRWVGSSVGSQISATILAASVTLSHRLPTDAAFRTAFLVSAGISLVAAGAALLVPAGSMEATDPILALAQAAAPGPLVGETMTITPGPRGHDKG
jgi:hypothetical protein